MTWVLVRSTKCKVWSQDVDVKTEPENLHENQALGIFGSQGSPDGKQWAWNAIKTKKQKSTSTQEIVKHCTQNPEYFHTL